MQKGTSVDFNFPVDFQAATAALYSSRILPFLTNSDPENICYKKLSSLIVHNDPALPAELISDLKSNWQF